MTELAAIAPKSLIFMRRYEVTDFPWHFLTIFYKMDVSTNFKYFKLQNIYISCQRVSVSDFLGQRVARKSNWSTTTKVVSLNPTPTSDQTQTVSFKYLGSLTHRENFICQGPLTQALHVSKTCPSRIDPPLVLVETVVWI